MEELEAEGKWEKAFAGSEDILDKLADKALAAHKQGETKPLNIKVLWFPEPLTTSGNATINCQSK